MLRLLRETVIVPYWENIFLNKSSCTICVVWQRTTIVSDFPFGLYTFKSPYRNPSIYALSASVPSKSYLGYLVWALLLVLKGIFNSFKRFLTVTPLHLNCKPISCGVQFFTRYSSRKLASEIWIFCLPTIKFYREPVVQTSKLTNTPLSLF